MAELNKRLFTDFPPVSTSAWEEKIREDLKGADYDKKLLWNSPEGIRVKPYYRDEDVANLPHISALPGEAPFVRGRSASDNTWFVRQDIVVTNAAEANARALDVLNKGVDSLGFRFAKSFEYTDANIKALLDNICLPAIEVNFMCGHRASKLVPVLVAYFREKGYKADEVKGAVNFDPIGFLCRKGKYCSGSSAEAFSLAATLTSQLSAWPGFKAISIHGSYFANAGSTITQELAYTLASACEYMDKLTDDGIKPDVAASALKFNFSVSANFFFEIAKFRAARLLWSKIQEAYGIAPVAMNIHAETSKWNLTAYDPWVNLLRGTTESMSAIVAGIDSLTVHPYNMAVEESTLFAERIARNTQIILKEESYLDRVADPSAGSYYIESLTATIAAEAWRLLLEVSDKGGLISALGSGFVQEVIEKVALKRDQNIATRRDTILGINQYPNFGEKLAENPQGDVFHCCCPGCGCKDEGCNCDASCHCGCHSSGATEVRPLRMYRGAAAFEALRLRTDLSGKRPKVFMLTIGNLAMRLARSQFSSNFFACAGFEAIDNNGFASIADGVKAAIDKKADIVVLCASDDEYAQFGPEAHTLLDGKAILVIAGAPACTDELKAKGILNFINVKSNVLETLESYQTMLNIK